MELVEIYRYISSFTLYEYRHTDSRPGRATLPSWYRHTDTPTPWKPMVTDTPTTDTPRRELSWESG